MAINLADKPEKFPGKQVASFSVKDIEKIYKRVLDIGNINIVQKIKETNYGKVFFIKDPDGNKIEFVYSEIG